MKAASYLARVGGFVSVNAGNVKDCYTDAKVKYENNVSGFVFENSGDITSSIAQDQTTGKENVAGFCFKNKGKISNSGWLCFTPKEKDRGYTDADLAIRYEKAEELQEKLDADTVYRVVEKKVSHLEFANDDIYLLDKLSYEASFIEISNANELMEVAMKIASGDEDAAAAHYRLACDINLHGKKWLPIGLSEMIPFKGVFDGAGHKITNFKISSKKLEYAGFFGYLKGGRVANLSLDCVVNASGGNITGCMCGTNDNGEIINCRVAAKVSAEKVCGGFVGKNTGKIEKCCFVGKISPVVPLILIFLPAGLLFLLLLSIGLGIMISNLTRSPWSPEIIDPNARPVVDDTPVTPPPAGSNRISFELNQEVYISSASQVGIINYVNPKRSTQDVVIRVIISDAELKRTIGKTGRSVSEQAALEADENYDPEKSYQELYRSGRIKIGYSIEAVKLSALADGTLLPVGDYEMIVAIDAYNPDTNEKSVVNAQAPITVHIVEPKS